MNWLGDKKRILPKGCEIRNIHRGVGDRDCYVYAQLYSPSGELLISATLDYITNEIKKSEIN